jgi:two-component SAPR family response regulator
MLNLTLFGSLSVSIHQSKRVVPLALSPRVAELLAFLAMGRGRYYLRSDIADSVWNAEQTDATLNSVNTALWRLRRAIERAPAKAGDYLNTNAQGAIGLNGPVDVATDVSRFEQLLRRCRSITKERLSESQRADLRRAVDLYRGHALAEFRSPWALRERERLRNAYQ